jgi:hypothetical protein
VCADGLAQRHQVLLLQSGGLSSLGYFASRTSNQRLLSEIADAFAAVIKVPSSHLLRRPVA